MKKINYYLAGILILSAVACKKEANTNSLTAPNSEVATHSLGCEMLPASLYAAIPQAKTPNVALRTSILNLNVPPVGNQGSEGSCVAFGTTYDARSIDWQTNHPGTWDNTLNIFSPEFVYNQIKLKPSCSSGSYVVNGLNFLKTKGVCTWSVMPYVDGACSVVPTATQTSSALPYVITGYSTVAINAATIQAWLASGKSVIVAGPVNSAFENLASGAVLTTFKGRSLGGHCYCVVGYDDTKGAFKFMNSWGSTWSTAGFGYIAYANVAAWWTEAYVIN